MSVPPDQLYEVYRQAALSTDLPLTMYAGLQWKGWAPDGPRGIPLNVMDRAADLPNYMAVKFTQPMDLTTAFEIADRLSDRLLIGCVNLDFAALLARDFGMQWTGQWNADSLQVPSKRLAADYIDQISRKDFKAAFRTMAVMRPALDFFYQLQAPTILLGGHPWLHIKYYMWLGGGNGGVLPDLHQSKEAVPPLTPEDRRNMRAVFASCGLKTTDAPEEQFIVGKAAWERGLRAKDFPEAPLYIA